MELLGIIIYTSTDPEQKRTRKPDSPLYAVKGSTERDSSYRDRDNNRHGRGGRDHYSSNSQHRNLFTNNNRNKHKREFDNEKKTDPGELIGSLPVLLFEFEN